MQKNFIFMIFKAYHNIPKQLSVSPSAALLVLVQQTASFNDSIKIDDITLSLSLQYLDYLSIAEVLHLLCTFTVAICGYGLVLNINLARRKWCLVE